MTPAEIVKEHPILLEDLMQFCKNEMGAKLLFAMNSDGKMFRYPRVVTSQKLITYPVTETKKQSRERQREGIEVETYSYTVGIA